jgi:hypothetical protein
MMHHGSVHGVGLRTKKTSGFKLQMIVRSLSAGRIQHFPSAPAKMRQYLSIMYVSEGDIII